MSDYLDLVTSYQVGSWEKVNRLVGNLKISLDKLPQIYMEALGFADALYAATE